MSNQSHPVHRRADSRQCFGEDSRTGSPHGSNPRPLFFPQRDLGYPGIPRPQKSRSQLPSGQERSFSSRRCSGQKEKRLLLVASMAAGRIRFKDIMKHPYFMQLRKSRGYPLCMLSPLHPIIYDNELWAFCEL